MEGNWKPTSLHVPGSRPGPSALCRSGSSAEDVNGVHPTYCGGMLCNQRRCNVTAICTAERQSNEFPTLETLSASAQHGTWSHVRRNNCGAGCGVEASTSGEPRGGYEQYGKATRLQLGTFQSIPHSSVRIEVCGTVATGWRILNTSGPYIRLWVGCLIRFDTEPRSLIQVPPRGLVVRRRSGRVRNGMWFVGAWCPEDHKTNPSRIRLVSNPARRTFLQPIHPRR